MKFYLLTFSSEVPLLTMELMQNRMKKIQLFSLLFVIGILGCRDDIDDLTTETIRPDPDSIQLFDQEVQLVNASVIGFVKDNSQEPIPNAQVIYDGGSTVTDDYGHFIIRDIEMNAKGSVIRIEKEDYFKGNRRFFPLENKVSKIEIELIEKNYLSFDAKVGGLVHKSTTAGDITLNFEPNSIQKSDGTLHEGEVFVAIADVLENDMSVDRLIGNLQGVSSQIEEVALSAYSVIGVELVDASGNPLSILTGSSAEVYMPVPTSLRGTAPPTIPLWSFHEELGMWVEEGEAQYQSGAYRARLSRFSYWKCGLSSPCIDFNSRFVDMDGIPLVDTRVVISYGNLIAAYAYTDLNGEISGRIPTNQEFYMKVFDACKNSSPIHWQEIGPFFTDTDLGDVIVSNPNANNTVISGNFVDCNNDPLLNSLLLLDFNGQRKYRYLNTPNFNFGISSCNILGNLEITAIDLVNNVQSQTYIASLNMSTQLNDIRVCDSQIKSLLTLTVENTRYYFPIREITSRIVNGVEKSAIRCGGSDPLYSIDMVFDGVTAGDYGHANGRNEIFYWSEGIQISGAEFSQFDVTKLIGDYEEVEGSFSGDVGNFVPPGVTETVNVTGEFIWKK